MGCPKDARFVLRDSLLCLQVQWYVPSPGIYSHDSHAFLVEPFRRFGSDAAPFEHIIALPIIFIPSRVDEHNVHRLDGAIDALDLYLDVFHGHGISFGLVDHVELYAVAEKPFQGKLINGSGLLSLDATVVVPRRIHMSGVMRSEPGDGLGG